MTSISEDLYSICNSEIRGKRLRYFLILNILACIVITIMGYLAVQYNNPLILFIPLLIVISLGVGISRFFLVFGRR
jgi:small-conductance mechanosensitive channel